MKRYLLIALFALPLLAKEDAPVIGARDFPIYSEIDRFILTRLRDEKIEPSTTCSDIEFLRRAYLDVIGVIPTGTEARAFLNDKSPGKRARLIDNLLRHERYSDHWEVMWGDLLREHSAAKRKEGTVQGSYREWIREQLAKNTPYDEFARKLITASGDAQSNGAVNFYLRDMQNRVESVNTVAQVFMGTQMACAQCHDHPFDKWTQNDFHALMAFFARTEVSKIGKQAKKNGDIARVSEKNFGEYHMPKDGDSANKRRPNMSGEIVTAVFPWDHSKTQTGPGLRREKLAEFVMGTRQFAAVQVNRLWAQLFGRGLVDPVDNFREKNQPTHPELLDYLTDEFIKSKYNNKHVLKLILNSAAYQRSSLATPQNQSDLSLYSHQRTRRMASEEIFDSILMATGHEYGLKDVPTVARQEDKTAAKRGGRTKPGDLDWASDLPTPAKTGTFMNTFNQPARDVIVVSRDETGSVTQALEMLNGKAVNDAVNSSPLTRSLLARKFDARGAIAEIYLSTLSRQPTQTEIATVLKFQEPTGQWISDLQWALLNSREFGFIK